MASRTGHTDSHSDTDSSSSKSNPSDKKAVIERLAYEEYGGAIKCIKERYKAIKRSGSTESEIKKGSVQHTGGGAKGVLETTAIYLSFTDAHVMEEFSNKW